MKTTIEMHGFEIVIEGTEEGILTVSALKDGDVVEEFTLEAGEDYSDMEGEESEGEEIKGFSEFGEGEEEDFEDSEDDEDMDDEDMDDEVQDVDDEEELEGDEDMDEEEEKESKLESFQFFINKKRK